ncbi:uncharacterized protein TrAFT101_001240 [Trichoderma asperellum]|uniref:uncharacterized protein n=1 Tax=Trichoderma asperellum TaxID=101201 RepID=UPI0033268430|nr:hypothetical protein TrAFT101_001240 [Trichoderma asperellum]
MGRDSSGVSRHLPVTWPRLQHMYSPCIQAGWRRSPTAKDSHVLALRGRRTAAARYCILYALRRRAISRAPKPDRPLLGPDGLGADCGSLWLVLPLAAPVARLPHTILPESWARNARPPNHRPRPRGPSCIDAAVSPWLAAATGRPRASSGALDRPIEAPSSPVANS